MIFFKWFIIVLYGLLTIIEAIGVWTASNNMHLRAAFISMILLMIPVIYALST